MKSLVVGASAGLGRALSECLASYGHDLVLIASDSRDLEALAQDLRIRFECKVEIFIYDLSKIDNDKLDLLEVLDLNNLFYVAGWLNSDKDFSLLSLKEIEKIVKINFESAVKIFGKTLNQIIKNNGNLVAIGSVAQARPRKINTVYAASKLAFEFYFQGVRHYLAREKVGVQFYRVGFMDTNMNKSKTGLISKADVRDIAKIIYKNLGKNIPSAYLPHKWKWMMAVYSRIPWFIFKRFG